MEVLIMTKPSVVLALILVMLLCSCFGKGGNTMSRINSDTAVISH
jgi:hypothetical protein